MLNVEGSVIVVPQAAIKRQNDHEKGRPPWNPMQKLPCLPFILFILFSKIKESSTYVTRKGPYFQKKKAFPPLHSPPTLSSPIMP